MRDKEEFNKNKYVLSLLDGLYTLYILLCESRICIVHFVWVFQFIHFRKTQLKLFGGVWVECV